MLAIFSVAKKRDNYILQRQHLHNPEGKKQPTSVRRELFSFLRKALTFTFLTKYK